jgi:hypothetical protein
MGCIVQVLKNTPSSIVLLDSSYNADEAQMVISLPNCKVNVAKIGVCYQPNSR